jgi:hypothetical protein
MAKCVDAPLPSLVIAFNDLPRADPSSSLSLQDASVNDVERWVFILYPKQVKPTKTPARHETERREKVQEFLEIRDQADAKFRKGRPKDMQQALQLFKQAQKVIGVGIFGDEELANLHIRSAVTLLQIGTYSPSLPFIPSHLYELILVLFASCASLMSCRIVRRLRREAARGVRLQANLCSQLRLLLSSNVRHHRRCSGLWAKTIGS